MVNHRLHIRVCVAMLVGMVVATACTRKSGYRKCSGSVWATTYHVTYRCDRQLDDSILQVFSLVEQSLSPFVEHSLISRINRGDSLRVDSLLQRIWQVSDSVHKLSGGVFDPTVAPLVNLWGFGYSKNADTCPSSEEIHHALTAVGFGRCTIAADGRIIRPSQGMCFNFSAITKGYATQLIGEMLRRNGCADYMVEIGGELSLSGFNPSGEPWHVMLDMPKVYDTPAGHTPLTMLSLTDCGVATSGNYRNWRTTSDGSRVWHTIDPRTGHPAQTSTLSATVVASQCIWADALATACMAMEPDSALIMIGRVPGVKVVLVVADETAPDSMRVISTL